MTDFILHDGTYVELGQQYQYTMFVGNFVCTIVALHPMTERMEIHWELEQPMDDSNITWSSFELGYRVGIIQRYEKGKPTKKIPPLNFL
jgi:hypothetical protein